MRVTRAVDYGLRALILMCREPLGARFFLQDLAKRANLPRNYLVKVLKSLSAAGIVRSYRGIKGGFSLMREPKEVTLRQVVEAIDGPVSLMHCLSDTGSCSRVGQCAVETVFARLRERILTELQAHTLQELLETQTRIDARGGCPSGPAAGGAPGALQAALSAGLSAPVSAAVLPQP